MDEKTKRLDEIIQEVVDHGLGEIHISIREDGYWLIRAEKWTRNPADIVISCAIEDSLQWSFRGIEIQDIGEKMLKQFKKIKI